MATYRVGNYWCEYNLSSLFCFTSNGTLNGDRLVMGAGTARQVRDRFPSIDRKIGIKIISNFSPECGTYEYGLLVSDRWPDAKIAAFQTKYHWKDKSDIDLIRLGINQLQEWCRLYPEARVDLPMPGIGLGGLDTSVVKDLTDVLPDQVNMWTL